MPRETYGLTVLEIKNIQCCLPASVCCRNRSKPRQSGWGNELVRSGSVESLVHDCGQSPCPSSLFALESGAHKILNLSQLGTSRQDTSSLSV